MIKHCQTLKARARFQFVNPESGRKITVEPGALFWVTTSGLTQQLESCVRIDRKGRGTLSHGYPFAESDIREFFEFVA